MTLPRCDLGALPTPLTPARRLGRALGVNLHVKRDDLIGFGLAGTKTRAIEHLLADALAGRHDRVVGCGGPTSNFCPGLAMGGAAVGLPVTLVLYGSDKAARSWGVRAARQAGAEVHLVDVGRDQVEETAALVAEEAVAAGGRPYLVPRGGATEVGACGAFEAVTELGAQLASPPARVVVAGGSGGTAAGLLAGLSTTGWPTVLTVAAVSRSVDETRDRVTELARRVSARKGLPAPRPDQLEVHDAAGPGFGRPGPGAAEAAGLALRTEGILLDPAYTAKAATLLSGLGGSPAPVVFWHTGGVAAAIEGWDRDTAPAAAVGP